MSSLAATRQFCYNKFAMLSRENILRTAQSLVRQYNLPLKIRGVEELPEAVAIYFTADKKVRLRELAQELEFQLNLPIKLEQVKETELGKIGGIDILGKYPCCAPFLRKCPFAGKYGCGYGFTSSSKLKVQSAKLKKEKKMPKEAKPPKPQKEKKKRRKMVRRVVIKG